MPELHPGLVVLFGSGETSPSGGRIFESVAQRLAGHLRAVILETPAGFELNSAQVAGRIANFLRQRLQNYQPEIAVIPARKRNISFSPDNPELILPLLQANLIFLGPGSPTYAVRQLHESRAWQTLVARHRQGATIVMASAATIAASTQALPVYEIYKVGEDLHWLQGLDFFGDYGLSLVFIPHWNNTEGGAELDTSHCFMGQARFTQLLTLIPQEMTIVGIDEHTALMIDVESALCHVMGHGGGTVIRSGKEQHFASQQSFSLTALGSFKLPEPTLGIPSIIWEETLAAQTEIAKPAVPSEIMVLAEERQAARDRRDWATADSLRQHIAALGRNVLDTPEGTRLAHR